MLRGGAALALSVAICMADMAIVLMLCFVASGTLSCTKAMMVMLEQTFLGILVLLAMMRETMAPILMQVNDWESRR